MLKFYVGYLEVYRLRSRRQDAGDRFVVQMDRRRSDAQRTICKRIACLNVIWLLKISQPDSLVGRDLIRSTDGQSPEHLTERSREIYFICLGFS
jgi:hypothetical protein